MLIEQLFAEGLMTMGPSAHDPSKQIGVFPPQLISRIVSERAAGIESFRWIEGDWDYQNIVPATRFNPSYSDDGSMTFAIREGWVCSIAPDGKENRWITFDPFSKQWIYLLTKGSYGMLRSADGLVFIGLMTMIGKNLDWRMTWTKVSNDEFAFVNEELENGADWVYIDEWQFKRKA
jgi:hypothetical protein